MTLSIPASETSSSLRRAYSPTEMAMRNAMTLILFQVGRLEVDGGEVQHVELFLGVVVGRVEFMMVF